MAKKRVNQKQPAPRSIRRIFPQVKYIKDADKPMEVNVRKSDCSTAIPFDSTECALAKAAKREYHADYAVIGLASSYIIKGDTAVRYRSGQSVAREIISFDRHNDFAPGEYNLTPYSPSLRLGVDNRSTRKSGKSKTAKRKIHKSAKVRDLTLTSGVRA